MAVPPPDTAAPGAADSFVERLADDMRRRWAAGERPTVEEYFDLHPALREDPDRGVELIYEEVCLREEFLPDEPAEAVLDRFPHWRPQLVTLLECHRLLAPGPAAPRFPGPGDALGGFRLVAELGRGSQGRVFLAVEAELADRPVVLKFTPRGGGEHLSLARLQHTHIVPVYSVHDFPDRRLHALCLPFFGGTTLDRVLRELGPGKALPRTGADLLAALARSAPAPTGPGAGPESGFPADGSYARAVCWIGARLAEALAYAHERGLLHLDLKPSNVLLAADGTPMLLDFHLAHPPIPRGASPPAWLGGTPAYMAPEQRAALEAVRLARAVPAAVDGRADLFALGVLLYEALVGALPAGKRPARVLRQRNPQVTPGLADVLGRCLEPDPRDRYPSAGALADDLRRYLADEPLRGVANRSPAERWSKWRRRKPFAAPLFVLLTTTVVVGGLALLRGRERVLQAEGALRQGEEHLHASRYESAIGEFRRGLALLEGVPVTGGLHERFTRPLRQAEQGRATEQLHEVAERLRTIASADGLPDAEARALDAQCRRLWDDAARFDDTLKPESPELRQQFRADLLDLAVLRAYLCAHLAPRDPGARWEALAVLEDAEQRFGGGCVLYHERARHAAALGLGDLAAQAKRAAAETPPATASEHFAMGRVSFLVGDLEGAETRFRGTLELQPGHFWANLYLGKCAYQRGRFEEALRSFHAAVVLEPRRAWCFHNRALALAALGRLGEALGDYDRALRLDPTLAAALLNRAVLRYRLNDYEAALSDLGAALERGADPAAVHFNRGLVYRDRGDIGQARACLREALKHDPNHKDARALLDSLGQR